MSQSKKPASSKIKGSSSAASADQTQPIYTKPHDEQVDLLAQALLREYMHRKGYKEALAAFDAECPRDENTVSSRKVMGDLMLLSADKQKKIKEQGLETVMEMLCYDRVEKKDQMAQMASLQSVLATELPPLFVAPPIPTVKEKKAKKEKSDKKDKKAETELSEKKKNKASKKDKIAKKSLGTSDFYAEMDALIDKELPAVEHVSLKKKGPSDGPKKRVTIITDDDTPKSKKESKDANDEAEAAARAYGGASSSSSSDNDSNSDDKGKDSSDSDAASDEDFATALKRIQQQEEANKKSKSVELKQTAEGKKEAQWGIHSSPPSKAPSSAANPQENSNPSSSGPAPLTQQRMPHSAPLGTSVALSLMTALVGGGAQSSYRKIPNSFLRQGFHFNSESSGGEVRYGLLQNEGGPCGVLAAIQAPLLAQFMNNKFIITSDVQRSFLVTVLADSLLLCQPNVSQIVVVSVASSTGAAPWPTSSTAAEQKSFLAEQVGRAGHSFTSRRQLEACLTDLVVGVDESVEVPATAQAADWCRKDGYGLLCFVLSLLLSKGVDTLKKDMDVEQPLIVEHGYCSQELTNLVLTGFATSNVHDGEQDSGGVTLKGFMRSPMPVGFLSFLETKEYLTVGHSAKHPTSPVWLIYHESHYTCLFMKKDQRAAADTLFAKDGVASFDIFYYDQHGYQDEEIRLTITLDRMPLPAQRKDALVPYLNVIIRTVPEWSTARINWNGTDPLL